MRQASKEAHATGFMDQSQTSRIMKSLTFSFLVLASACALLSVADGSHQEVSGINTDAAKEFFKLGGSDDADDAAPAPDISAAPSEQSPPTTSVPPQQQQQEEGTAPHQQEPVHFHRPPAGEDGGGVERAPGKENNVARNCRRRKLRLSYTGGYPPVVHRTSAQMSGGPPADQ
jgi:hypothetical protein